MSTELIGILFILLLLLLIIIRAPVGISLLTVGLAGFISISGWKSGLTQLGMSTFNMSTNYTLSVIPLFILMGMFLSYSGLGQQLFKVVDDWIGHVRGGLAMASVGASAIFSSISGSPMSTTATVGRVALPEMKRYNYDPGLAGASVAAGGTLGLLIPPSVGMILYGILTMQSIGPLLIAGLLPGIILAVLFMLTLNIQIRLKPELAPVAMEKKPLLEKIRSTKYVWPVLLLFLLVIGGIYIGFFTPTEAAGVGAAGAFLFALVTRQLNWKKFVGAVDESIRLTAMIFVILIGANLFGNFLAITRIPTKLSSVVAGLDVSPYVILVAILFIYLILGLFMEGIAILVLTIPIVYPVVIELGFNGIWFGVILMVVQNMGLLTPPLGMNCYIIHGIDKSISLPTIFRGVTPMLLTMAIFTVLLIIFPEIALFLLNFM